MKCNVCGRELKNQGNVYVEDFITVKKSWGYFSRKDGTTMEMHVCEECFDRWCKSFKIPPKIEETIEMI